MFARLGKLVTRRAPWVIAAWVIVTVVLVLVAPSLSSVSNPNAGNLVPSSSESAQAQILAQQTFPESAKATSVFVVTRSDGGELAAADLARVPTFVQGLNAAAIAHVAGVMTDQNMMAPDGKAQLVTVVFAGSPSDRALEDAVAPLRDKADALLSGSGLQAGLTGTVAVQADSTAAVDSAALLVGIVTVLLILVLLSLVFRSPLAAILPLACIGLVYELSNAVLALLAKGLGFQIDQSLAPMLIVVLFGIGTDYVLFLLFRHRERLRAGDEPRAAMVTAVSRAGKAIASSGLVVLVAVAALFLARVPSFRTIAPTLLIAVALMVLASLTLIPSLVTLLGRHIFWPSKGWMTARQSRVWTAVAGQVGRRPGWMALASGGLLAALCVGAIFMHSSYDLSAAMSSDSRSAVATQRLEASFPPGALSPTYVYVAAGQPLTQDELTRLSNQIAQVSGVARVADPVLSADGKAAQITVNLTALPASSEAMSIAERLKTTVHAAAAPGEQVRVGGQSMLYADLQAGARRDYSVVLPVAAVLILLLLAVVLRGIVAPLYLLAGVFLGFGATLGTSVIAFQGIAGNDGTFYFMTLVSYIFVLAVGSDYNILMTSRLREELAEGAAPHDAAAMAVRHAAPTVAAAGIILAGTFASLMLSGIGLLSQIGFAVMTGIVLVALVMAGIFIPSVATLLGRHSERKLLRRGERYSEGTHGASPTRTGKRYPILGATHGDEE